MKPRLRIAGFALIAGLGVVLSANACGGDPCTPGETQCRGAAIFACGSAGDTTTSSSAFSAIERGCGADHCLDVTDEGKRVAACSTSGARDPRCAPGALGPTCVDGHTFLVCEHGYSSQEKSCGSCVVSAGSAVSTPLTFCAIEAAENPLCGGDSVRVCDGNALIDCTRGWVTARSPCDAASPSCVLTVSKRDAYCAETATCAGADDVSCDGTAVRGCIAGHVVDTTCDASEPCEARVTPPRCTPKCKNLESAVCVDP